jgi:hypothetical protein
MDPQILLLQGILIPAVVAGTLLALAWKVWAKGHETDGRWAGALAIFGAFTAAMLLMGGWPASPMPDSNRTPTGLDWMFWVGLPCCALLPLVSRWGLLGQGFLRLLVATTVVRYVLKGQFQSNWSGSDGWLWLAGLSALYLMLWAALDRLSARCSPRSSNAQLWLLACSVAILAALSGSAKIGQLAGSVAAGLGAAIVVSWKCPRLRLTGAGVSMVLMLLFGLGLNAHFYSYTTAMDILLLGSAPLLVLLVELPGLREWRPRSRGLLGLTLLALPMVVAITRAVLLWAQQASEAADDYYY